MPVLECRCGMVMSVPAANLRATCIRCGGAQLGQVESPSVRQGSIQVSGLIGVHPGDTLPLVLQLVGEAAVQVASRLVCK